MTLPTPESVSQLLATLEHHTKARQGQTPLALGARGRLLPAVAREHQHGSTRSDGYATQTLGDGMPRGSGSDLTATEAAAFARMDRGQRDAHRFHTDRACRALERAVSALNDLEVNLDAMEAQRGHEATTEPCEACGAHRDRMAAIHRRSDVKGRLAAPAALCSACYDFVRRVAPRFPTPTEVAYHEARGRWSKDRDVRGTP